MNVPKAVEVAAAVMFRTNSELGAGVVIRAWQSLATDAAWNKESDRSLPMLALLCGTPRYDADQATLYVDLKILCATDNDDDKSHDAISKLYGAVQGTLDDLFDQHQAQEGPVWAKFSESLSNDLGGKFEGVGGLSFVDGLDPTDDEGNNMIGLVMRVHYSRKKQ